ncbi:uncharacterized protein LOC131078988 [Cryptomeria japonica]|uniref:uncharacterized protein LOC131078988 n=1 Tax=Cryptomeria japonica TaxID=3369 RepID=UPI0025ABE4DB|nr:uncharacterized protein LOC131078988 [Cryptomeria japonica]
MHDMAVISSSIKFWRIISAVVEVVGCDLGQKKSSWKLKVRGELMNKNSCQRIFICCDRLQVDGRDEIIFRSVDLKVRRHDSVVIIILVEAVVDLFACCAGPRLLGLSVWHQIFVYGGAIIVYDFNSVLRSFLRRFIPRYTSSWK